MARLERARRCCSVPQARFDHAAGSTAQPPMPGAPHIEPAAPAVGVTCRATFTMPAVLWHRGYWHATARHNPSGRERVAVVNRWCPWWLSVDDFAPGDKYNVYHVCRPINHAEYLALPPDLQPLMRHLCPDECDTLQQPVLDRAEAAHERTLWGYQQEEENPESMQHINAHIKVPVVPLRC